MTLNEKAIIELKKLRKQMSKAHDALRDCQNKTCTEKADELSGANVLVKDWIIGLGGEA